MAKSLSIRDMDLIRMNPFRYVGELRNVLSVYPGDLPIKFSFDGGVDEQEMVADYTVGELRNELSVHPDGRPLKFSFNGNVAELAMVTDAAPSPRANASNPRCINMMLFASNT